MGFYVYILRTNKNTLYTGQTNNIDKRLKEHQQKSTYSSKYLRAFASFKLVYLKKYSTRTEALQKEAAIKKLTKAEKETLIKKL